MRLLFRSLTTSASDGSFSPENSPTSEKWFNVGFVGWNFGDDLGKHHLFASIVGDWGFEEGFYNCHGVGILFGLQKYSHNACTKGRNLSTL